MNATEMLEKLVTSIEKDGPLYESGSGDLYCFFCGEIIKGKPDHHHLNGKQNESIYFPFLYCGIGC